MDENDTPRAKARRATGERTAASSVRRLQRRSSWNAEKVEENVSQKKTGRNSRRRENALAACAADPSAEHMKINAMSCVKFVVMGSVNHAKFVKSSDTGSLQFVKNSDVFFLFEKKENSEMGSVRFLQDLATKRNTRKKRKRTSVTTTNSTSTNTNTSTSTSTSKSNEQNENNENQSNKTTPTTITATRKEKELEEVEENNKNKGKKEQQEQSEEQEQERPRKSHVPCATLMCCSNSRSLPVASAGAMS